MIFVAKQSRVYEARLRAYIPELKWNAVDCMR
jgi:hypothetical protein